MLEKLKEAFRQWKHQENLCNQNVSVKIEYDCFEETVYSDDFFAAKQITIVARELLRCKKQNRLYTRKYEIDPMDDSFEKEVLQMDLSPQVISELNNRFFNNVIKHHNDVWIKMKGPALKYHWILTQVKNKQHHID